MNIILIERLWKRTIVKDGCWLWTGNVGNDNYGRIQYQNKTVLVHRLALCIYHKIDYRDKFNSCHICKNKNCWNPLHLYIGDHFDNMRDAVIHKTNFNTKKDFCINGHLFTKESTYFHRGRRQCRICKMERQREYMIRRRKNGFR